MNQEKIGSFIAENRKAKGFTQIEFAEKLGVSSVGNRKKYAGCVAVFAYM